METSKSRRNTALLAAAAALAAACSGNTPGPWNTAPTRETHARFFAISAGTAHATVDCNTCHGAFDTFRQFDCIGCHTAATTDPRHTGVGGYRNESTACYGCHRDGGGAIESHRPRRLLPAQPRLGERHRPDGLLQLPRQPVRPDAARLQHLPRARAGHHDHRARRGGRLDLLRRHLRGVPRPGRRPDRDRPRRLLAIAGGTAHATSGCLQCHPQDQAARPWTRDFATFDCLACHAAAETTPRHSGVTNYQYLSTACYACHRDGAGGVNPAVHSASFFPIATGAVHATASCDQCHTSSADRKVIDCTTCHEHAATTMTTAHAAVGGFGTGGAGCIVCHADSQVHAVSAHTQFRISSGSHHYRSSCVRCHTAKRTDKTWAADFSVPDCLGCHGQTTTNEQHAGRSGYSWATAACLRCHPTGNGD
ncbi:MAG: hypothetical protein QM767_00620 [Anaeromyxobacter sp.]